MHFCSGPTMQNHSGVDNRQSLSSIDSIVDCLNELNPLDQRQLKAA